VKRFLWIVPVFLGLALMTGCGDSSDDGPTTPPDPEIYTASANLHNHVVGDGTVDTQMSFRQGATVNLANHVVPGGVAINRGLLLDDPSQLSAIEIFLTAGDGAVLNPGEEFTLERDKRYVFIALGNLAVASGQIKPQIHQLDALGEPAPGKVRFRFTHALAGSPAPVDVYVNDEVVRNLSFAQSSPEIEFDARAEDEDSLIIVATGVIPDGSNEIYRGEGQTLFQSGLDYEAVLGHRPRNGFNGDINGALGLYLSEAH
jgi:hypothetical protein